MVTQSSDYCAVHHIVWLKSLLVGLKIIIILALHYIAPVFILTEKMITSTIMAVPHPNQIIIYSCG